MYFRMSKEQFEFVHDIIKNKIQKKSTQFRDPISTRERLAVCLRFLATGNSFRSIAFNYRLGFSTVRKIVAEVCDAIWETLGSTVFPTPTEENWKKVAERFNLLWNFPNCIGAIDGKHINIRCPINGGSSFYNYKGNHSIVLLALVDAEYKFISIDVGFYGRNSDENGEAQPYVIVGDEAFPLKSYLLRPYSKHYLTNNEPNKIFNYRLSRARRVVENAFGILAARWRVFQKPLEVQPTMVDKIVLASCSLHNMLCSDAKCDPNNTLLESQPEPHLTALQNVDNLRRNCTQTAFQVRENFKEYFNSRTGSVPWQTDIVRRGEL
nr:protein ANTAGONIST OF LIKE HETEROCHROMATIN PROTEIN 1-like isoform X2 [Onthophagus taurus]